MSVKEILQLGNPKLWERSTPVEDPKSLSYLIQDLSDTLAAFREGRGYGRAIAAPQIGVQKRLVFVRMQGFCGAFINPEIISASDEKIELWDDCFSFPDLLVRVSRSLSIEVVYRDEAGSKQTIRASGDLSELLQHEIDHLDGILAVQRAVSDKAFATRSEWERMILKASKES
ncbi:MAG: peptide deformylase [Blastocatellia bacterium]|nr:peptide deformylase [Blastocatellia bacterium]